MSKIDLTAAELREWAGPQGDGEAGGAFDTRLALALADAMEERDELKRRLETAGKVCCDLVEERGKLRADLEAAREAIREGTTKTYLLSSNPLVYLYGWKYQGSAVKIDHRVYPAVRAAWEGKS